MTERQATPKPGKKSSPALWALLPCLLLLAAFAACGPDDEEMELVELQEAAPSAGSSPEPAPIEEGIGPPPTDVEGAPLEPAAPLEETPPERAPLGPELEAPPPGEGAGAPEEEMPVDPDELEEELDAAEPVPPAPAALPAAETQAAGREVFLAQRCDSCHSVSSAEIEGKTASGGDLTGVGERRERAWIAAMLRGDETVDGKRHPKKFSGSQAELDALIDWLLAQE